jgi:hypothetical protein
MQEQVVLMLANDNMSTKYMTARVKMIVHAPHGTFNKPIAEFQIDSRTLFGACALITREMAAWTYVKPLAKKRDECSAITAVYNHYLEPNNFNDHTMAAEDILNKATYRGRVSHWNFVTYTSLHMKQHEIQEPI